MHVKAQFTRTSKHNYDTIRTLHDKTQIIA
jgi:hypothetical protein